VVKNLCLVFLLISFDPLCSLGQGMRVDVVKDIDLPVNPSASQTIIHKLSNDQENAFPLKVETELPQQLKLLLCPKTMLIDGGSSKNLLLTFSIPKNAKAGGYEIKLVLRDSSDNIFYSYQKEIRVKRVTLITARHLKSAVYVRGGEKATMTYLVSNEGNAEERLTFSSKFASVDGSSNVVLLPDSSITITVSAQTQKEILMPEDVSLDLRILNEQGVQLKSVQKSITVYPTKSIKNDPFVRLPLMVSASALGRKLGDEKFMTTYQYQITADGGIDSSGKHRIDFMYRGPDQINVARIGTFSQKYIGYSNPRFSGYVGERTYSSSILTDMFRFGIGSELRYNGKKIQFKSYYVKPRFMPDIKGVASLSGQYAVSRFSSTNFSFVRKQLSDGKSIGLAGAGFGFNNGKNFKTDMSMATSLNNHFSSPAYQGNLEWGIGNFRASGNALYASKDFQGYFSNTLFLSLNTGYSYKKFRLLAGWGFNDANPVQDTVYGVAPYSSSISLGIGFKPTKMASLVVQVIKRKKEDRFENKKFDYEEDFIKLIASRNWKKTGLSVSSEWGNTQNFLLKDRGGVSRNSDVLLNFNYKKSENFSFSIFSHFLQTNRYTVSKQKILLYGSTISLSLKSKIQFNLQYQNNFLIEELYSDRNLFDAKLNYQVNKKTSLGLYSNYAILFGKGQQRDLYSLITLNREIGIPVARVMTFGTIEGCIIHRGKGKIEGIILFLNGSSAITNAEGKFVFNNIKAGKHKLALDRGSLSLNDVTEQTMPFEIEVFPATVRKIEIGIVTASRIDGLIRIAKGTRLVRASGNELKLPQVVIEISNQTQTILTTTQGDGKFSYMGLTPGSWQVRVIQTTWKSDFIMETDHYTIELEGGKSSEVTFELSPKIKQIKYKEAKTIDIGK
jgi:hypothetical protein